VRYVLWFVFFTQKDKARLWFIIDCVVYTVIVLWMTVMWENGAENSGMDSLICITKMVKDDTKLWLVNSFKKSTYAFMENVVSWYQNLLKNFHKLRGLLCIEFSWTDWVTLSSMHRGYQNNWMHNLAAPFFHEGLQKLVSRYDRCLNVDGSYVEK
jgi:hypothetical protein